MEFGKDYSGFWTSTMIPGERQGCFPFDYEAVTKLVPSAKADSLCSA